MACEAGEVIFKGQVQIAKQRTTADNGSRFVVMLTSEGWPDECFPGEYAVFDAEAARQGEKVFQERALAVIHELFREAISNGDLAVR